MRMLKSAIAAVAFAGAACGIAIAPTAQAQKPITKPPVASPLFWTTQQQLDRYKAMETVFEVRTVKAGPTASPLPVSDKKIDPPVIVGGKTTSIDQLMKDYHITGLIAVKDGKIVLEKYGDGRTAQDRWTSFSVAKSVTSSLIGAAIKEGWITSLYDPVTKYLPELKGTAYDGVNIKQVISMSSGVKWNEDYTNPKSDVALSGALPPKTSLSPIVDYMAKLPAEAPPGSKWVYKTGETDLAGALLERALAGKTLSQYASEKIWIPFGMEKDAIWMVDLGGHERGGCCMSMTLRDYARVGLFMLGGGKAGGVQVLPEGWTSEATVNQVPEGSQSLYGYFWWPHPDGSSYEARGIFGQGIGIYPEQHVVIAINSAMKHATDKTQSEVKQAIFKAIVDAAK